MCTENKWKAKCILTAVAAACFVYLLLAYLITLQYQKQEANANLQSSIYGNLLWTEVDRELNSLLFMSNGMASYISAYRHDLQPDKIQFILKDLWQRSKHVRNLSLAVGYKITYVYPEQNNKIVGIDFRELSRQWPKVKEAIDKREGVFDGPLELIQGGHGFVYRFPIYIDDKYWGILSTVINTDEFLKSAFEHTPNSHGFAIRTYGNKHIFYGNPALFADPESFKQTSIVPNGKWEWAIKNNDKPRSIYKVISQVSILLISLIFGIVTYHRLKQRVKLSEQAMLDSLTNLPNRRLLHERMEATFAYSKRFHKMMAILAIDVDYFKNINDTYGHDFGDEILKIVGNGIKATLRGSDTVSRIGGDEFIAVLKEFKTIDNVHAVARKLTTVFAEPWVVKEEQIEIHLSIGISIFDPEHPVSLKQLSKEADIALYKAKADGRNRYCFYKNEQI